MSLKLQLPKLIDAKPRLTVIGVGGAGCNAINNMIAAGLQGVEFVVANTDAQCLAASSAEHRIQLGANLTEGLGAGSKPEIGEAAAEEAIEEIRTHIAGAHMVFIAAGMGGGTGTGAASVIARASREMGALTVGIVTKPFQFEGARRMRSAEAGVNALRQHVDTLIVIPNQNLFRIANERTTFAEAFVLADQVLYSGVACIVDLVLKEGLINLDFADVRTVMSGMGTAMMGTGEASGDRRAILAAEEAIANPLLDDVSLKGARGLLLSITGGRDLTLYEVDEAASRVREEVDPDCNIIVGATFDDNLGERVRVSIVASGMKRVGETSNPMAPAIAPAPHAVPAQFARPAVPPQMMPQQAHVPAPQFAGQTPEDMHRRLSEAFNPSMTSAHQAPVQTAAPQPPVMPQRQEAPREGWSAGNNVMIEEGFTPFGQHAHRTPSHYAAPIAAATDPHQGSHGFEPAAPADVRRAPRRIPAVEDLPPVGQREWHAKQPGSASTTQPVDEHRKKGLFDRLAGLGRRQDGRPHDDPSAQDSQEETKLPEFFGRARR